MDTRFFCRSDVSGLAVQQKVGEGRPNQGCTNVCHLLELLFSKSNTVDQHQFTDQEVVLNEDVKFRPASLIDAFCNVNEPRVQLTTGVTCFDVVADVIRGEFRHLGVNLVPFEIVVFDVSCKHGGVAVIGVAGSALGSSGPADQGFHFDVLHGLRFHVPVGS